MNRLRLAYQALVKGLWLPFMLAPVGLSQANSVIEQDKETIIERLKSHSILKGSFLQTRTLQGFARPLTSTGEFIYWRQHGLHWEIQSPFYQGFTYKADEIIVWKNRKELKNANERSAIQRNISRVLLSALSADMEKLSSYFDIEWLIDGEHWAIEFLSSNKRVGDFVAKMSMSGKDYIEKLVIHSAGNDVTEVEFSMIEYPDGLEEGQCVLFYKPGMADCHLSK